MKADNIGLCKVCWSSGVELSLEKDEFLALCHDCMNRKRVGEEQKK